MLADSSALIHVVRSDGIFKLLIRLFVPAVCLMHNSRSLESVVFSEHYMDISYEA